MGRRCGGVEVESKAGAGTNMVGLMMGHVVPHKGQGGTTLIGSGMGKRQA